MKVTLIALADRPENYTFRLFKALLESRGHQVRLLYLNIGRIYSSVTLTDDLKGELVEFLRDAEVVGVYVFTFNYHLAVALSRLIRAHLDPLLLWGGPHCIAEPGECVPHADLVCVNEGEEVLLAILERLARDGKGFSRADLPNLAWQEEGRCQRTPVRPSAIPPDTLPFQDFSLREHYWIDPGNRIAPLTYADLKRADGGLLIYITMLARGCPFRCTFCLNSSDACIAYSAARSVDHVIAELKHAQATLPVPIDRVMFYDDDFFALPAERIAEFSDKYRAGIGLPLQQLNASAANFNEAKLQLLVAAGATGVIVGVQSLSEIGRKTFRNPASKERVARIVEVMRRYPALKLFLQIILGNPFETDPDIADTLLFLDGLPLTFELVAFQLVIYPGTQLQAKIKDDPRFADRVREGYTLPYTYIRPELKLWTFLVNRYLVKKEHFPRRQRQLMEQGRFRLLSAITFFRLRRLVTVARTYADRSTRVLGFLKAHGVRATVRKIIRDAIHVLIRART